MEDEKLAHEVDTLKKFGNIFQIKCISLIISDRVFLERISDIISPDYFEADAHKWIVKLAMDYFPKYKNIPTFEVFKVEISKISDAVLSASLVEQIKAAYNYTSSTDMEYVRETFLEFCKNKKLESAIWKSYNFLKRGDYDSIWSAINEASKAGTERNFGHDYYSDIDSRMAASAREIVKTNWSIIDTHLDGGLGKGELGFVVAPAGSGKSWFLTHMGCEAMRQGKNVMHFTMELNEKYVGLRYDSCISNIAFQDVRKNSSIIKPIIDKFKSNGGGKLFIKYFPINTASASTLRTHIDRLQLMTGVKIDLVIVDYADLLRPLNPNKNANSYSEAGSTYEELRGVLGEMNLPGWTASQANRGAHEESLIQAQSVADSYKKVMTGDFIMSLSRTTADKMAGTGRIHIMKSRFGSDGNNYLCKFDASCGSINIYDEKSVEGMELLSKLKNEQDNLKDILRKTWSKVRTAEDSSD